MFKKLTPQEQIRCERQERLVLQNRQMGTNKIILEQLVDLDFRQSLAELGLGVA